MTSDQYSFLNRDLSWLSFNYRVLMEAADDTVPLYERLSFLSIFSSNLDEFFRVRMPAIYAFSAIRPKKANLQDEYPRDLPEQVRTALADQLRDFGEILTGRILPSLQQHHIILYYNQPIHTEHQEPILDHFLSRVLSFLQPVLLREGNQGNVFMENNCLYFVLDLEPIPDLSLKAPAGLSLQTNPESSLQTAHTPPGQTSRAPSLQTSPESSREATPRPGLRTYALLNIPSAELPRFVQLPSLNEEQYYIFLDDIILENLREVFRGFTIHGAWSVKLTRDAEMELEDEFTGDIAEKIEKQLQKRDFGHSTRFLYDSSMPQEIVSFLRHYFSLRAEEMVPGGRYHNLKDLSSLPDPTSGALKFRPQPPISHPAFGNHHSVFHIIREKERLLHLPYHSYNTILRFFNEAAIDPSVREIYVTLYRIAAHSHIANALISAARNGKKVTVFVELKARFDEANNLHWSKKMKEAGVKIINSLPGLKVHAKIAMVRRLEDGQFRHYSLLATGNFNESTARFYTDHVFFTTNPAFSTELLSLFSYLQDPGELTTNHDTAKNRAFNQLLVSQFNMMGRFFAMIDREIAHARNGQKAEIIIKLNNLQERELIGRLYEAGHAGVKIKLLIRSICCLAAGIPAQSDNITIHRIVGRYLEHGRVFIFHNNGQTEYYLGSADWMDRNLHSRIEVIFPLYDPQLREEIRQILELQLADTAKAVYITPSLDNQPVPPLPNQSPLDSQQAIYELINSISR